MKCLLFVALNFNLTARTFILKLRYFIKIKKDLSKKKSDATYF